MDEATFLKRLSESPGDVPVLREYSLFLKACGDPRGEHLAAELELLDAESRFLMAERHLGRIRSERTQDFDWLNTVHPMVTRSYVAGLFYTSLEPGGEPLVALGDFCSRDTVVGVIESSHVFYQIAAGHSGIITEVFAQNSTSVSVGDPLFKLVRPKMADALRARHR